MRFLWWIPTIALGLLIYWFSDQSQPPGAELSPDYIMHFFGFGLFSVAVAAGMTKGFRARLTLRRALAAFFFVLVYGCLDEFHQSFVPGRTATVLDILADSLGALVLLVLVVLIVRSKNQRFES